MNSELNNEPTHEQLIEEHRAIVTTKVQERLAGLGIHSLEGAFVYHRAQVLIAIGKDGKEVMEILHPATLADEALAKDLPYEDAPSVFNEEAETTPFREKYTKRAFGDFF